MAQKYGAKIVVVSALTVNMVIIDRFLIPEIFLYEGERVSDIPSQTLAQFGAIVGFSAGVWISALLLGGIGLLKAMSAMTLFLFLAPLIAAATIAGSAFALLASWTPSQGAVRLEQPAQ